MNAHSNNKIIPLGVVFLIGLHYKISNIAVQLKIGVNMAIKLIATDMDGTLLNDKKEMPESFIPWVKAHPEVKVVIASGRQYYTLEDQFMDIRDELIFIAENGSLVFDKGETIFIAPMEDDSVSKIIDIVRTVPNAFPLLCGENSGHIEKNSDPDFEYNAKLYYKRLEEVDDIKEVLGKDRIVKVAVFFKNRSAEAGVPYFKEVPGNNKSVLSGDSWIDVAEKTSNKGAALRAIQKRFGISYEETMSFGDYFNDLELLQASGESYAMSNAHPDIIKIAKYTAPDNNHEGVIQVLNRVFRK